MKLESVLTPSSIRNFQNDPLPSKKLTKLDIARNERFSFQAAFRSDEETRVSTSVVAPKGWKTRIRLAGYVPVPHQNPPYSIDPLDNDCVGKIPGFVPDPLFDLSETFLPAHETNSFWFTIQPAKGTEPGLYEIAVSLQSHDPEMKPAGKPKILKLKVCVHNIEMKPRKDFDITHWFYADCLQTWYKTYSFTERFWELLEAYMKDIAEHAQNVIYVPLFTPSLDTDKFPSQLLKVSETKNGYSFDWSDVRRYVRLAKKCGITKFEWAHLFSQWGCEFAIRIYKGQGETQELLWPFKEVKATDQKYRDFLTQLLPEWKAFLEEEKILKKSFFHISDEPHGDFARGNYIAAKQMMNELAPWMHFMDAVSQIEFGKIVDMPVPSIRTALDFHQAGIESWCYYCGGPRNPFLNHLIEMPLAKIAMHGFLFYRWPFKGFLHWGYNYWNRCQTRELIDPFTVLDAKAWPSWSFGDTFLVYPGENGPIDSMRWEIIAESMQDYALLQTLGVDREDKLLKKIVSFSDFPKDASWRLAVRAKLFAAVDEQK